MAASCQSFEDCNQVKNSYSGNTNTLLHGRSCSKAQACLHKILRIISTFKPCESDTSVDRELDGCGRGLCCGNRGFAIDLNLRLGASSETGEPESPAGGEGLSACSAVGEAVESESPAAEKSSGSECEAKEEEANRSEKVVVEEEEEEEEEEEVIGIDDNGVGEETKAEEQNEERDKTKPLCSEEHKSDGFIGLLIEAAKLISGDFDDDEDDGKPEPKNTRMKREQETEEEDDAIKTRSRAKRRSQCWMVDFCGDFDDVSPVVRSKRGRSQVLPSRYRDSVLEPWRRLSRERSTAVSSKRRSR